MAYYTINRACGHVEEVDIRGTDVRGERKRRAAWLATHDCGACHRHKRQEQRDALAEQATALAEVLLLPDLDGSPKQVAWAQDIRLSFLAALAGQIHGDPVTPTIGAVVLASVVAGRGLAGDHTPRLWAGADPDLVLAVYTRVVLRQTRAKWWIDRRDLTVPVRDLMDVVNAGVSRLHHGGGLLAAVEEIFTDDDRAELAALVAS